MGAAMARADSRSRCVLDLLPMTAASPLRGELKAVVRVLTPTRDA